MMLAKARGRLGVTLKSLTRVNPRTIRLLKRLNTLAALGGNGRLARSREVTRLNRAGHTGSVDFDPEWLHVALHQQMQAPDGGWRAWSVVFGYFLVCFSTLGVQWAYSAIYGELLRALDEGPALTALVGSLCMGVMEGFAVLAALTISRFGSQRACQIGGVLAVAGLLLSAACTSVWQLCLTFGIITGLGHSLAHSADASLVQYEAHTRARARQHWRGTHASGARTGPAADGGNDRLAANVPRARRGDRPATRPRERTTH